MAIEFRCTQCNRLLRTPDGTAGKEAKCPECGAVSTIPEASLEPPPPPEGPSAPGSPFAAAGPPPTGFDPENPYTSPSQYAPATAGYAAAPGQIRPTIIDIGDVLGRTWSIFQVQWGQCLIVFLVAAAVFAPIIILSSVGNQIVAHAARGDMEPVVLFQILSNLVVNLISTWIGIGVTLCFLRIARGQKVDLGDVFRGGYCYFRALGARILVGLICLLGFLACIVPGVILALMFSQVIILIVDRNMGIMEAMGVSREITTGNKVTLFLLWLVQIGIGMLGFLACCVGYFPAMGFIILSYCVAYLVMTGQPTADQMLPPVPPAAS